jgi:O-antigen/teichoic acid export membrane protein
VGNISTPIIADFHSRGEISQLKKLYQITTKWVVMFNVPLFIFLVLFSKSLLSVFGSDFTYGSLALIILAIGNLVYTGTGLGANILDMTNHTKINSANSALLVIVTITTDLLLIPRWGVMGAAVASAFSTVIVNIACLFEVYWLFKMYPYTRNILKPTFAGLITAIISFMLYHYVVLPPLMFLFVGGVVLWGVYALVLFLLGFSAEDLLVINSFRNRIKLMIPLSKSHIS